MNFTLMWTQQLCTHGHVHMFYCHASHTARLLDGSICFYRWWKYLLFHFFELFLKPLTRQRKVTRTRLNVRLTKAPQLPTPGVKNTPPPFQTLTGHQWGHVFSNMTALVYTNNLCFVYYKQYLYLFHSTTHAAVKLSVFQPQQQHVLPHLQKSQTIHLISTCECLDAQMSAHICWAPREHQRSTTLLPDEVFDAMTLLPHGLCHMYWRQTATSRQHIYLTTCSSWYLIMGNCKRCNLYTQTINNTRLSNLDTWLNVSPAEPLLVFYSWFQQ